LMPPCQRPELFGQGERQKKILGGNPSPRRRPRL
jgi:hypothetical protein